MNRSAFTGLAAAWLCCIGAELSAETYSVGPGESYEAVGDVPLDTLTAGDVVEIHWRETPYAEKFVLGAMGSKAEPVVIRGVPNDAGELPVIDGRDAVTPTGLDFWNESRGLIKIGGANSPSCDPPDCVPSWIVIENLALRSARPPYTFIDADGETETYAENAAAVYVEVGAHLTIRGCELYDSGNGLFIGAFDGETQDVLIQGNYLYDNGIEGSAYEHNSYTAARGITFQFNRYGSLREGCDGNNLKDRSAGLTVRYNWLENGNRQLDLVDGEDTATVPADPRYGETFVYGNILIEGDGEGNSQIVHYGGDSGTEAQYRKGTLYFYNNTVVSTRAGNTTLFRLSTNDEHCDARNNIFYVTEDGSRLALLNEAGSVDLSHNWFKPGRVDVHGTLTGTVNDDGTSIESDDPGFSDLETQSFDLADNSICLNAGTELPAAALPNYDLYEQYVPHCQSASRPVEPPLDLGAFERCLSGDCETVTPPDTPDSGASADTDSAAQTADESDAGSNTENDDSGCGCHAVAASTPSLLYSLLVWTAGSR